MKMKSIECETKCLLITIVFLSMCLRANGQSDVTKRKTGNLCKGDTECPDNAFCRMSDGSGYCVCKDEYIFHLFNDTHRECIKEATRLGDVCKVDLQCQSRLSIHTICLNGVCTCKEGAHFDEGRCYETALIGQRCVVTQNCYLGPDESISNQAYCVRGVCTCSLLHSPRDGGTRCLKDAMLGDQCEDDEHCTTENSRCGDVCRCREGFVLHPEEKRCLKEATAIGDACEIESQCTSRLNSTTCIDQKCGCNDATHLNNGVCWTTKLQGQRCINNQECVMIDSNLPGECVDGICTCKGCSYNGGAASIDNLGLKLVSALTAAVIFVNLS